MSKPGSGAANESTNTTTTTTIAKVTITITFTIKNEVTSGLKTKLTLSSSCISRIIMVFAGQTATISTATTRRDEVVNDNALLY